MYALLTVLMAGAGLAVAEGLQQPPSPLKWDVYLAPETPVNDPLAPGLSFSPTAFTLIHGAHSAILVDAPITTNHTLELADWIEKTIPNKNLTHVYVTHGHGDHFFGIPVLQQRFPGLTPIATAETIAHIAEQLEPDFFNSLWAPAFPGQIPLQTEVFEALPPNGEFMLEGNQVQAVQLGQSDTYNTTVLHVPSLSLVVTGDVVYGNCFQYLEETNTTALREQWIESIDEVEKLGIRNVVPSHMREGDGFGVEHFEATKEYVRVWGRELRATKSAAELEARMIQLYPQRVGNFILRFSAERGVPA